jgi:hypothetical protein
LEAEKVNPSLLDDYAEYCILATTDDAYRESAEKGILRVTSFLSPLLAAEKSDGRCMPTTLLLQRFLDGEGIWNFPQKGGVVVQFPPESMLRPKLLQPQNATGGTYGHACTVAPPFRVVDLTIARQFYTPAEQGYISGDLMAKDVTAETEPVFRECGEPGEMIRSLFSPFTASLTPCTISYYPYGTGGPTETFAEMNNPILKSLRPLDLYQAFLEWKREQPV